MKPVVEMTDDELDAEVERLKAFKVPSAPVAKAPKRPKAESSKKKKASWKEQMGL